MTGSSAIVRQAPIIATAIAALVCVLGLRHWQHDHGVATGVMVVVSSIWIGALVAVLIAVRRDRLISERRRTDIVLAVGALASASLCVYMSFTRASDGLNGLFLFVAPILAALVTWLLTRPHIEWPAVAALTAVCLFLAH